jgi:aspartate/methionine/tyrosine aminotransferase
LLEHLAHLEHVEVGHYDIVLAERFCVDLASLRQAISDRTRAILAVHPNNPTGSYLHASELEAMLATGLPLISDEVFAPYPLDEPAPLPSARSLAEDRGLVLSLHGLSKLGLPQMKLSWMCVTGEPGKVAQALERLELIADTFLSVATPIQLALPAILESRAPVLEALRARLRENLATVRTELAGSALSVLPVEGGFSVVLRLPAVCSDEEWALHVLEQEHVLVQPGYFYDFGAGPFAVLSLLPQPDRMREGTRRLRNAVESAL